MVMSAISEGYKRNCSNSHKRMWHSTTMALNDKKSISESADILKYVFCNRTMLLNIPTRFQLTSKIIYLFLHRPHFFKSNHLFHLRSIIIWYPVNKKQKMPTHYCFIFLIKHMITLHFRFNNASMQLNGADRAILFCITLVSHGMDDDRKLASVVPNRWHCMSNNGESSSTSATRTKVC